MTTKDIGAPAVDPAQAFTLATRVDEFHALPSQAADQVVDLSMGFPGRARRHASSMLDVLTGELVAV